MNNQIDNKLDVIIGNQTITLKKCDSISVDESIVKERGEEIEKLHKDIIELNQTFREFNEYIIQQSDDIQTIATNIETTQYDVNIGNKEIIKAEEYQSSLIKKKLIITTLAITAINVPVGLFFGAKVALATISASLFSYFI